MDEEIEVNHPREAHEPGLQKQYNGDARRQKIIDAVVAVAQPENGPVPDEVEEGEHHREGIVDAGAVVAFVQQLLAAMRAARMDAQQAAEWKNSFLFKDGTLAAIGAFVGQQAR